MSYDRPLLIGYKTLVINVFHMSSEIFTFTQQKKRKKIPKGKTMFYRTFKISLLIPTTHMCELNSCRKYFSRIKFFGKCNRVVIVSSEIFISSMGMSYFFMGYYILRRETLKTEVVISSPDKGLSFDIHIYFTKLRITS